MLTDWGIWPCLSYSLTNRSAYEILSSLWMLKIDWSKIYNKHVFSQHIASNFLCKTSVKRDALTRESGGNLFYLVQSIDLSRMKVNRKLYCRRKFFFTSNWLRQERKKQSVWSIHSRFRRVCLKLTKIVVCLWR